MEPSRNYTSYARLRRVLTSLLMQISFLKLLLQILRCVNLAFVLFLGATLEPCLSCQEVAKGGIDNREAAVNFCRNLQQAVRTKEKAQIAGWVNGYPIQMEYTPFVHPIGQRGSTQTILISDDDDFVDNFDTIFNSDVSRMLFSNTACELGDRPDGSATIANRKIEIDQLENGARTVILTIAAPENYERFYEDKSTYELGAKNFLIELQHALLADDRKKVAGLCRYPLRVNFPKKQILVENRKEFLRKYPQVLTPEVKNAVIQLKTPILAGWRGFMTERGEVWFDLVVGTNVLRVGTINVP